MRAKVEEHRILLNRVEAMTDVQCAWLILYFCCVTRANYYFRTIQPEGSEEFAVAHDTAISRVFSSLLTSEETRALSTLQTFRAGWEAWVCGTHSEKFKLRIGPVGPIRRFHSITVTLGRGGGGPHTEAVARCQESLIELGFDVPE